MPAREELYQIYGLWEDTLDLEDELEVAAVVYSPETLAYDYDLPFNVCVELKKTPRPKNTAKIFY